LEPGVDLAGGLVEQVGAAQISGEDEVAGEHVTRVLAEGTVGDQERQVFWGVSWGVACLDGDVADGDGVTVHETFGVETVLPVLASFTGDVNRGVGRRGQFSGPGEVVGVDVGLGHRHDLHVVFAGQVEVDVDVSAGIDHD